MRDDVAGFGDMGLQEILDIGQVGDAGDDIKGLPAAIAFAQDRLAEGDGVAGSASR